MITIKYENRVARLVVPLLMFLTIHCAGQIKVNPMNDVGIGTNVPDPSSKMEVFSNNKGIILPKMSLIQRNAIANPADGLQVYVVDNDHLVRGPYYYDGKAKLWIKLGSGGGGSIISVADSPTIDFSSNGNLISGNLTVSGVNQGMYNNATLGIDQYGRITNATSNTSLYEGMNTVYNSGPGGNNIPQSPATTSVGGVTISPSSTTAKILINARVSVLKGTSNTVREVMLILRRGTTNIDTCRITSSVLQNTMYGPGVFVFHDIPGTTTPVVYEILATGIAASNTSSVNKWELSAVELSGKVGPDGPKGPVGNVGNQGTQGPIGLPGVPAINGYISAGTGINVTGSGTSSSPYVINSAFVEADGSNSNEIQTLSTNGMPGNVALSIGGSNININVNDTDHNPNNELQTLAINGNQLSISGGNSIALPPVTDSWSLQGNNLSQEKTIGSISDQNFTIKTNNKERLWIDKEGRINTILKEDSTSVGIGYVFPNSPLDSPGENVLIGDNIGNYNVGYFWNHTIIGHNVNSNLTPFYGNLQSTIIGTEAAYASEGGDQQTFFGCGAGLHVKGGGNISIGNASFTPYNSSNVNYIGSAAIGYSTHINQSKLCRIGNSSTQSIGGVVGWSITSDQRFKTNVQNINYGLDFILRLRPVEYKFDIKKYNKDIGMKDSLRNVLQEDKIEKKNKVGFLAQEVEQIVKEMGITFSGVDKPENPEGFYGLSYEEFVVPLVKATQEQQMVIEKQIETVNEHQKSIDGFSKLVMDLTNRVEKLEKK